jgi:dolichyl-diphosphooligosaccharide--protein glycosyltransferase
MAFNNVVRMTGWINKESLYRRRREGIILAGVLLTALALRLYTYSYEYLMGVDPFHHYRIAAYILETGSFPERWYLSRYPLGEVIVQPMGLYYASILLYKALAPMGFSLMQAFKLAPPFFGVATLIPVYLITKDLFGRRQAFYATLLLAFLPAFTYRTLAGFYRGDAFFTFFMATGLYFYLRSLADPRLAFLAGACFGLMGVVWNGFIFGFVVLSFSLVLYSVVAYLRGGSSKKALLSYVITVALGVGMIKYLVLVQGDGGGWFLGDLTRYIIPATIAFAGFLVLLGYAAPQLSSRSKLLVILGVSLAALVAAFYFSPEALKQMLLGYGLVKGGDPFLGTIGELYPPSLEHLWQYFPVTSLLFLAGVAFLLRERRAKMVIIAAWLLAGLYMLTAAIRYTFLASIPIGIVASLSLSKLDKTRLKTLPTGVLLLAIAASGMQFAAESKPTISEEWYEALSFLKTREPGAVLTWWDYGSWVQGITGFPTVTDTVHGQDVGRMRETARLLLETDESATLATLRKYEVKYVVINVNMIGQMHNLNALLETSYQYPLFIYSGRKQVFGGMAADYSDFLVLNTIDGKMVLYNAGDKMLVVERVYWREEGGLRQGEYGNFPILRGAVYIPEPEMTSHFPDRDFIIYIPPELEKTLLTSLMLLDGKGFPSYELIFKNSQVRIYKIVT